ncbi:MAG: hypothetical protein V3V74_07040 [Nitrosomonadaceae bacterium]
MKYGIILFAFCMVAYLFISKSPSPDGEGLSIELDKKVDKEERALLIQIAEAGIVTGKKPPKKFVQLGNDLMLPDTVTADTCKNISQIFGDIKPVVYFDQKDSFTLGNYKQISEASNWEESDYDYHNYSANYKLNDKTVYLQTYVVKNLYSMKVRLADNFGRSGIPIVMKRGDSIGVNVGDYNLIFDDDLSYHGNSSAGRTIVFVRNNVYCKIHCANVSASDLLDLANEIDQKIQDTSVDAKRKPKPERKPDKIYADNEIIYRPTKKEVDSND